MMGKETESRRTVAAPQKKRSARKVTLRKRGKKPIRFRKGALHRALGVPQDKEIPPGKKRDALAGKYGPKVKRMTVFAFKGALAKGRKTARKRRK